MTLDVSEAVPDVVVDPDEALAEFEPDHFGGGNTEPAAAASDTVDDPQWIVWSDAEEEAVWAGVELTQIGAGWRV